MILTGDVHFGRIAICELTPGRDIVEVVASPLALVAPIPPNKWKPAPDLFPTEAMNGIARRPVRTVEGFQLNANHFSTVGFTRSGCVRPHAGPRLAGRDQRPATRAVTRVRAHDQLRSRR